MIHGAVRSRIYELRRDRAAAQRSAALLEQKREVLLRELLRRERNRSAARAVLERLYAEARGHLRVARVELGIDAIESATLAQPPLTALNITASSIMSVRIPIVGANLPPWHAHYGAAATSESLDETGASFAAVLRTLLALAQEDAAISRIRLALRKTTKLSGALRKVVLPRIERDIREVVDAIEEEERDEAVRLRRGRG